MTKLVFGGILGADPLVLDAPPGLSVTERGTDTLRISGAGPFVLTLAHAEQTVTLRRAGRNEAGALELTVVRESAGPDPRYRVVGGRIRAALELLPDPWPLAARFGLSTDDSVELTAEGMLFADAPRGQKAFALSRGSFGPTPAGLAQLSGIALTGAPDWQQWRDSLRSGEDGSWQAAFDSWHALPLEGGETLNLRIRSARWAGGELVLSEDPIAPPAPAAAAPPREAALPVLTWRMGAGWSTSAHGVGVLPVPPRTQEAPANPAGPLWLRGVDRSWVRLDLDARATARVHETRAVVIARGLPPRPPADAPGGGDPPEPGYVVELLPDGTRRIELVLDPATKKAVELRLTGPALRVTTPALAVDGGRLVRPDLPPAEGNDLRGRDAVWLTTGEADGPTPLALCVGDGAGGPGWRLRADGSLATHFRRVDTPLDTPPAWAANDAAASGRPSPLRALFPHTGGARMDLYLEHAGVRPAGAGVLSRVAEPDRPTFSLRHDHPGFELLGVEGAEIRYRLRHAVAALDDRYRAAAESLGARVGPTPLDATYVEEFAIPTNPNDPKKVNRSAPASLDPFAAASVDAAPARSAGHGWDAPRIHPARFNGEPLGFSLVTERFADGKLRRWGVNGPVILGGVLLYPRTLEEGNGLTLVLHADDGDGGPDSLAGEIGLRFDAPTEADGCRLRELTDKSWLRLPAETFIADETPHSVLALECAGLAIPAGGAGRLRAGELRLWRGHQPDQSRLRLDGWVAELTAAGDNAGDFQLRLQQVARGPAAGATPEVVAAVDGASGRLKSVEIVHHLPTLRLREVVVGPGAADPHPFSLAFGDRQLAGAVRRHGHRVLVAWAEQARVPANAPDVAVPGLNGVNVTSLTRAFLELGRLDSGGLEVIGGMLGWSGGTLFGLGVNADPDAVFPQVTLTWPAREPAPGDDGRPPVLELNGTWNFTHKGPDGSHRLDVHFWDAEIPLQDRGSPQLPADATVRALVDHTLVYPPGKRSIKGFAFHTGRIRDGQLDLSATLYAERRHARDSGNPHAGGLKRRGLKGFRIILSPPPRLVGGGATGPWALLVLRCGPRWTRALAMKVADALQPHEPVLSWARGLGFLDAPSDDAWRALDPVGATAETAAVWWSGADSFGDLVGTAVLSTLGVRGEATEWLPCPIEQELKPGELPARMPRHRLWVVSGRGLRLLHTFRASTPADDEVQRLARGILLRSGWHREAVLERWDAGTGTLSWNLVDSPLLNRSVSLARFTGEVEPMRALLPLAREESSTERLAPSAAGAPTLQLSASDGALLVRGLRAADGATVAGVQLSREVPFQVDAGPHPLRGRLTDGVRLAGAPFVPPDGRRAPDEVAAGRPFLPSTLTIHPSRPRPGEMVRQGVSAWSGDADGIRVSEGRAVRYRTPRWEHAPFRVGAPRLGTPVKVGALYRQEVSWLVDSSAAGAPSLAPYPFATDAGTRSIVLVHGPGAREAHPGDPISAWVLLPAGYGTLEPRPELHLKLAATPTAAAPPAVIRAEYYGADGALLHTTEREVAMATLTGDGWRLLGTEPPGATTRVQVVVRLRPEGIDRAATRQAELSVRAQHAEAVDGAGGVQTLALHDNAPRVASSSGMVGLLARPAGGAPGAAPRLVAYGAEPPTEWKPVADAREVTWERRTHWTDWRAPGDPPIESLFYLTREGVFIHSD